MMADFSADKQALEKSMVIFDTDMKVEDVTGYPQKRGSDLDVFLLHTLLEVCCSYVEPNPSKRKPLFKELEAYLIREKFLNPRVNFDALAHVRKQSAQKLVIFLNKVRSSILPSSPESITPKLPNIGFPKKYPDIYQKNFQELKVIAEGGFGTVCMAVHKVDGLIYAVKKIIFNCEREEDFNKVMSEVKSISMLCHKNIVSYKNCWIQLRNSWDETVASSTTSSYISARFSSLRQKKEKMKCARILSSTPDKSALPSSSESKVLDRSGDSLSIKDSDGSLSLLQQVLSGAYNKSILPASGDTFTNSWRSSTHDQTLELEIDQSHLCGDFSKNNLPSRLISTSPNLTLSSTLSNTSSTSSVLNSAGEETFSESMSCQSVVFCSSENCSQQNLVSPSNNNDITSTLSSGYANSCCSDSPQDQILQSKSDHSRMLHDSVKNCFRQNLAAISESSSSTSNGSSNSTHDQMPTESDNDVIMQFCDSCQGNPAPNLIFPRDNIDLSSISSNSSSNSQVTGSAGHKVSSDSDSIVFIDSTGNDLPSTDHRITGDFGGSTSAASHKNLSVANWLLSSTPAKKGGNINISTNYMKDHSWRITNFTGMLCIQMEYCDCDLRLWLEQRNEGDVLPFQKEIKNIYKEILKGVAHIHSKSIIHRDLKPQNIFYSKRDNSMKIGDFGLATLGHSSTNRQRVVYTHYTSNLGTYPYAAPEQMKKHDYDNKVDIYSLGIILIELLLPFQTRSEFFLTIPQIMEGNLPDELTSQWPSYVDLVKNLVQKDPKLRMSAKEILDLPIMEDDSEMDKRQLLSEINDLKKALVEKDKEFENALKEKDAIIEKLCLQTKELTNAVKNLKNRKSRNKH